MKIIFYFLCMKCFFLNNQITYKDPLYEKYCLWNNKLLSTYPNINIEQDWYELDIPISKQFNKYFSHANIQNFLKTIPDYFLISVVYLEPPAKYDTLPCFTETMLLGESVEQCKKRFLREELFSGSDVNYLANNKWKKQKIHTMYKDVEYLIIDDEEIINSKGEDFWRKKMNLLLFGKTLESCRKFITQWRERRHNLGTEMERLYMVDVVLISVKDIL